MALKRELKAEDIVLGLTVLFTFLYPLIITGIILFQEAEKENRALKRINKILEVLTRRDCEESVFEIAPYTEVEPSRLKTLCVFTKGRGVKGSEVKREGDELIYRARVNDGFLTIVGVWDMNRFRIIFIGYDKGR